MKVWLRENAVIVAVGVVALAVVAVVVGLALRQETSCEPDEACLSPADLELVDELRSDGLLATEPPGTTGGSDHVSTSCYHSGGWLSWIVWETTASDEELAEFYRSVASDGWTEEATTDASENVLVEFSRVSGDVGVSVLTEAPALGGADGVVLSVFSERLSESCTGGVSADE